MSEEINKAGQTEPEAKSDEMSEQDLGNVAGGTQQPPKPGLFEIEDYSF
jgi:hypothetical protein